MAVGEFALEVSTAHVPYLFSSLDIKPLHYLHNFTSEAVRAQCPGVNVARSVMHDVVAQGVLIPKGTMVLMQPSVIHKNPALWCSSYGKFRPNFWDSLSESDSEAAAPDPWAFTAFSHGPRIYIGRAFSIPGFKILIIELGSSFHLDRFGGDGMMAHEIEIKLVFKSDTQAGRRVGGDI